MDAVDFEEVAALRGVLRELTAEVATLRAQAEEDRQRGDGPVASESISEQMRAAAADARVKSAEGRLLEASAKLEVTQKALQRSRSDLEAARAGEAAARAAGEAARDRAEGMARELALAKRDTARLARAEVAAERSRSEAACLRAALEAALEADEEAMGALAERLVRLEGAAGPAQQPGAEGGDGAETTTARAKRARR